VADLLLPMDTGLDEYPILTVPAADVASLARGQHLDRRSEGLADGLVRVADEAGALVAIARVTGGTLKPEKVFVSIAG